MTTDTARMMVIGSEIRRRHASSLKTAPDASLAVVLMSQIQMYKTFEDDPMLCNRVLSYGVSVIPQEKRAQVLEIALKDGAELLYKAMYEGATFPVQRAEAKESDWSRLVADFYKAGGTEQDLSLVFEPDIGNPRTCSAMLAFFDTLYFAGFEGADRLRADMVSSMNSS